MEKAVVVLMEFWDSFSHDGAYRRMHLLKHRIITGNNWMNDLNTGS